MQWLHLLINLHSNKILLNNWKCQKKRKVTRLPKKMEANHPKVILKKQLKMMELKHPKRIKTKRKKKLLKILTRNQKLTVLNRSRIKLSRLWKKRMIKKIRCCFSSKLQIMISSPYLHYLTISTPIWMCKVSMRSISSCSRFRMMSNCKAKK